MAKKVPSNECPGIVCNLLKPHYRWFDVVLPDRPRSMFEAVRDGKKNTFFPGPKLFFPHKEDKPYRLRRSEGGHWEGRNNKGPWIKLTSENFRDPLNDLLEQMWQIHIVETMMSE